jgi:hypothetical protein
MMLMMTTMMTMMTMQCRLLLLRALPGGTAAPRSLTGGAASLIAWVGLTKDHEETCAVCVRLPNGS